MEQGYDSVYNQTSNKNNFISHGDWHYKTQYLEELNRGYDFKEDVFRDGRPEDYLSKSTNINYIPLKDVDPKISKNVDTFIEQLFPVKELRDYMWQHLSSSLIGTNENQTFNIYTGSGRNGKSMLTALMSKALGDYKGTVPITLITQKRNGIGGTSSEVVQLKGLRYAVMQEPTKGDKINEGIMKELTGGDPIQGRALYKDMITFVPHFKLVVCTNTLFDINSNDDGTWRRIRVCDFMAKFKENPVNDDEDEPYQYKVDKKLEEKFDVWSEVFMAKMVDIASKTKGNVEDCDIVMSKSNEYRDGQDYLSEFVKENIEKSQHSVIKKDELYQHFSTWYKEHYGRMVPKGKEIFDFMNNKFGKCKKKQWNGVKIVYVYDDEEDAEA
jgi:P4 family phage/plasmid primase-like protien